MINPTSNYAERLIFLGGVYHMGIAIFHLLFWRLFNWKKELELLSKINRGVMQILNLRLTFLFLVIGCISIFYPSELRSTHLGQALLIAFSLFWFGRLVEQVVFFGIRSRLSFIFALVFLLGSLFYIFPIFI